MSHSVVEFEFRTGRSRLLGWETRGLVALFRLLLPQRSLHRTVGHNSAPLYGLACGTFAIEDKNEALNVVSFMLFRLMAGRELPHVGQRELRAHAGIMAQSVHT